MNFAGFSLSPAAAEKGGVISRGGRKKRFTRFFYSLFAFSCNFAPLAQVVKLADTLL